MKWFQRIILFFVGFFASALAILTAALVAGLGWLSIKTGIELWHRADTHHDHSHDTHHDSHHDSESHGHGDDHAHGHGNKKVTWPELFAGIAIAACALLILYVLAAIGFFGLLWSARALTVPLFFALFTIALISPSTQSYAMKAAAAMGISVGALILLALGIIIFSPIIYFFCG